MYDFDFDEDIVIQWPSQESSLMCTLRESLIRNRFGSSSAGEGVAMDSTIHNLTTNQLHASLYQAVSINTIIASLARLIQKYYPLKLDCNAPVSARIDLISHEWLPHNRP